MDAEVLGLDADVEPDVVAIPGGGDVADVDATVVGAFSKDESKFDCGADCFWKKNIN